MLVVTTRKSCGGLELRQGQGLIKDAFYPLSIIYSQGSSSELVKNGTRTDQSMSDVPANNTHCDKAQQKGKTSQ
jgi:hypothetical protein